MDNLRGRCYNSSNNDFLFLSPKHEVSLAAAVLDR